MNSIKKYLKDTYEIFADKTYVSRLPNELLAPLNKAKILMISLAALMILGLILVGFSFEYVGACILVELLAFFYYLSIKKNLLNNKYKIYEGKIIDFESPWWIGGKLNRKKDKQILVMELKNSEIAKCALSGNINANIQIGSDIMVYARESYITEDNIIMIPTYYSIINKKCPNKKQIIKA